MSAHICEMAQFSASTVDENEIKSPSVVLKLIWLFCGADGGFNGIFLIEKSSNTLQLMKSLAHRNQNFRVKI